MVVTGLSLSILWMLSGLFRFAGIAEDVEMVATVEIDAANFYWNYTFCSEHLCLLRTMLGYVVEFSTIFGDFWVPLAVFFSLWGSLRAHF